MKKSILFVIVTVLAFHTTFAENKKPVNSKDPITAREKVSQLLKTPQFEVTEEILVRVTLMVTNDQEIVVFDVNSKDETVVNYIKSRLNYEKLNVGNAGERIILPVRIVPAA